MRTLRLFLLVLVLAGCGKSASVAIATGPADAIRHAASAARDCGVTKLRNDPLDDRTAVLLIDPGSSPDAIGCLKTWVRARPDLAPAVPSG